MESHCANISSDAVFTKAPKRGNLCHFFHISTRLYRSVENIIWKKKKGQWKCEASKQWSKCCPNVAAIDLNTLTAECWILGAKHLQHCPHTVLHVSSPSAHLPAPLLFHTSGGEKHSFLHSSPFSFVLHISLDFLPLGPPLFLFLFFFCMRIQVVCVCMCRKESTRGRGHGAGLGVGGVKTDKLRWRIIGGGPLQWGVRPRRSTPFQTLYQTPHSLLWLSSSLSLLPLLLHPLFLLEI